MATLTSVKITPRLASLSPGGTQQFIALGIWSDGSTKPLPVTWSATGGNVTSGGKYTAGTVAGSFFVKALQVGGTKGERAAITVSGSASTPPAPPPPPLPKPPPPPPATPPAPPIPPGGMAVIQDLGVIPSALLGNGRRVQVYLPPGYAGSVTRYPVLYLHDGQDVFNASLLDLNRRLTALITAGQVQPILVVAVHHRGTATRVVDYNRTSLYPRAVAEEIKPRIDASFRTLPGQGSTGVGGVSIGSGISWHMGLHHSNTFGMVIAQSSVVKSMSGVPGGLDLPAEVAAFPGKPPLRIWFDYGGAEGEAFFHGPANLQMVQALKAKGLVDGVDFKYTLAPGGLHNWPSWAPRFENALRFLFPGS